MVTVLEMPPENTTTPPPPSEPPEFAPPRRTCFGVLVSLFIALAVLVIVLIYFHKLQYATSAVMDGGVSQGERFGFHLMYVPFTFGDLHSGAKKAAWLYAALAAFIFYWVAARRGRLVAAILTFILLGASALFLERMCMARVYSLSVAALLLGIHLILTRRYRALAVVMFGTVWLCDDFPLLAGAAACLFVAEALVDKRLNVGLLRWTLLGMAAGIIINPAFPDNIVSYLSGPSGAAAGALPLGSGELLTMARAVWIVVGLGVLLGLLRGRPTRETVGLLLISFLATLLLMKAPRSMEIWPPLALLFAAYSWSDYWQEVVWQSPIRGRLMRGVATIALAGLILFTPAVYREAKGRIAAEKPVNSPSQPVSSER